MSNSKSFDEIMKDLDSIDTPEKKPNVCHTIQQNLHRIFGMIIVAFILIIAVSWNKIFDENEQFAISKCMSAFLYFEIYCKIDTKNTYKLL